VRQLSAPSFRIPVLDLIERLAILALFAEFAFRNLTVHPVNGAWVNWIVVVSEALPAAMVMIRRPSRLVSHRKRDWGIAFAATIFPMLIVPTSTHPALGPVVPAMSIMLLGLVTQLGAKLTLLRSFGIVPANHGVKTGGLYRYVRHPMYLGYVTVHLTFLFLVPSFWNLLVYGCAFSLQVTRMFAEERLLVRDPMYRNYRDMVRWRLMPGVF
jgi:protein-S-isoprenylcysteine O-methyltransferase Ste14